MDSHNPNSRIGEHHWSYPKTYGHGHSWDTIVTPKFLEDLKLRANRVDERIKQMVDKLGDRMTVQMTEAHGVLQGTLMTEEGKQITLPKVKGKSYVQTATEFAPGELKEEPEGEYPEVK